MEIKVNKSISILDKTVGIVAVDSGDGINITISGGDRGHIGAVGIASPETETSVISFPEHKEAVICEKWADTISRTLCVPVVVCSGIHYDNITPTAIQTILTTLDKELEIILQELT